MKIIGVSPSILFAIFPWQGKNRPYLPLAPLAPLAPVGMLPEQLVE